MEAGDQTQVLGFTSTLPTASFPFLINTPNNRTLRPPESVKAYFQLSFKEGGYQYQVWGTSMAFEILLWNMDTRFVLLGPTCPL